MAEISKTPKKGLSLPDHYDPSMEKIRDNMTLIDSILQKANPNDLTDIKDTNGERNLDVLTTTGRYYVKSGAINNPSGNAGIVDVFKVGSYILQEYRSVVNATYTYRRYSANSGSSWNGWIKDWNANNDGMNSGLDADTLDGIQGSGYIRTYYISDGSFNSLNKVGFYHLSDSVTDSPDPSEGYDWGCIVFVDGALNCQIATTDNDIGVLYMRKGISNNWTAWEKVWTSGIDGTGSGLDADLLDGKHSNEISIETVSGGSSSENHTVLLNMGEEESQLGDGKFYYVDSGYFRIIQDESCPVYHAPALVCLNRLGGTEYRVIVLYSGSISSGIINTSYNFMSSEPVYLNAARAEKLGDYFPSEYVRKTEFNTLLNNYSLQCVSGSKSPFIVDSIFDSIGSGKYVFINDGTYKFYSSGDEYNAPALISLNYLSYSNGKFVATVFNALNTVTYIVDLAENTTTISTTSINAEKLDGLSGDKYVTISNLLTKIRAIDGSGSGIDADLLDGSHLEDILSIPSIKTSTDTICLMDMGYGYNGDNYTPVLYLKGNGSFKLATNDELVHQAPALIVTHGYTGKSSEEIVLFSGYTVDVYGYNSCQTYDVEESDGVSTLSLVRMDVSKLNGHYGDEYLLLSNLLSSITGIDGHGTGLDADLLDGFHASTFSKYGESSGSFPTTSIGSASGLSAMYRFCDSNNLIGEGSSVYYGIMQIYYNASYYVRIAVSMSSGKVYRQTSGTTAWNEITPKIPVLSADPASPSDGQMWIRSDL